MKYRNAWALFNSRYRVQECPESGQLWTQQYRNAQALVSSGHMGKHRLLSQRSGKCSCWNHKDNLPLGCRDFLTSQAGYSKAYFLHLTTVSEPCVSLSFSSLDSINVLHTPLCHWPGRVVLLGMKFDQSCNKIGGLEAASLLVFQTKLVFTSLLLGFYTKIS